MIGIQRLEFCPLTCTTVVFKTSVLSFIGFGELILVGGELFRGDVDFDLPRRRVGIERRTILSLGNFEWGS